MIDWSDDIQTFDGAGIICLGDGPDAESIEAEIGQLPHLESDKRYEVAGTRREFRDVRQIDSALEHLARLPGPDEAFHLVTNGKYALWDMVPAVLMLADPAVLTDLHIATLGFSKANVAAMASLLDAGKIQRLSLLCSHYFKGTSNGIYESAVEVLTTRGQPFLSIRTHAKLLLVRLSDGRTITFEASANLRSCKNIEQITVIGDPGLYQFHRTWIDSLMEHK